MIKKLNILDWYCHQGNQYEFFKTGHNFYLAGRSGELPNWNEKTRPLNANVKLITESASKKIKFDIVIIRSGVSQSSYSHFINTGAIPIAVIQTTTPFHIPKECKDIIWNSNEVLKKYSKDLKKARHHYIVHGFDPEEFSNNNIDKNGRVLTLVNHFKSRDKFTGYSFWRSVISDLDFCDVFGEGNEDIGKNIVGLPTFSDLINIYNNYSIFFNPTTESAMPRSRGEAAMCGMPIVSTNNFDIKNYFTHKKNAILSNNKDEVRNGIRLLLKNESARMDFGLAAREVAIKHFHIKDYLLKWNQIFGMI
jgi:Glycosyl transferases group 1